VVQIDSSFEEETMTKQTLACCSLLSSILLGNAIAANNEYGTLADAKAMLARAVAAVKADRLGAIARFNHNDPQFRDRDLFVFCFNAQDGRFTAHEAMVTRDVRTFKDKNGTPYGQQMYSVATEGQISEIAYVSSFPGSTEQIAKRAFVTRIGDQICGVSVYQFDQ
jgi:hypothetical protein